MYTKIINVLFLGNKPKYVELYFTKNEHSSSYNKCMYLYIQRTKHITKTQTYAIEFVYRICFELHIYYRHI